MSDVAVGENSRRTHFVTLIEICVHIIRGISGRDYLRPGNTVRHLLCWQIQEKKERMKDVI